MTVDWAAIIKEMPQVAIFVVMIYFTLRMIELKNTSLNQIVDKNMESVSKITQQFATTVDQIMERNQQQSKTTMEEWRSFLAGQRKEDRACMDKLADEVRDLAHLIHEQYPRTPSTRKTKTKEEIQ